VQFAWLARLAEGQMVSKAHVGLANNGGFSDAALLGLPDAGQEFKFEEAVEP
jgi:hypothetical protein